MVTWWQHFENGVLRHYLSKATVIMDVFEQNIYQTISLITSYYTNMYQLFIFIQTFTGYQHHDIDVSIDITTLKALQYTNSKILIALMTMILTYDLYTSGFTKNNFIDHCNWR